MTSLKASKYLIVNADDYGYFSCVSEGILEGAKKGVITATGIMANSPTFDRHIEKLKQFSELDKGVHLNISYGHPLTNGLRKRFANCNGQFPDKSVIVRMVLTKQIRVVEIENEWRAQIQRCTDSEVTIQFLNSHEHLHMFPPFYRIFIKLAKEHGLEYSRHSEPEWALPLNIGSGIRNILLTIMHEINAKNANKKAPKLIGMNNSGKLSISYLRRALSTLKPGTVYELMCHPGYFDKDEIYDPRLLAYHDWKGELDVLSSSEFADLIRSNDIELVRYRDIPSLIRS